MRVSKRFQPIGFSRFQKNISNFHNSTTNIFDLTYLPVISTFGRDRRF